VQSLASEAPPVPNTKHVLLYPARVHHPLSSYLSDLSEAITVLSKIRVAELRNSPPSIAGSFIHGVKRSLKSEVDLDGSETKSVKSSMITSPVYLYRKGAINYAVPSVQYG
jgi:hypothetical protein